MADRRWNEDQEQVTDEDMVGKAAEENEEFEDVEDEDSDEEDREESSIDEQ